ncbi:MAG: porin [Pirellulaceae bacterium]
MKLSKLAILASMSCAWFAAQAAGQGVVQPASVRPAALSSNYYNLDDVAPSPSDAAVPPAAAEGAVEIPSAAEYVSSYNAGCGCSAVGCCDSGLDCTSMGCSSSCCNAGCSWCDLGDAWTLFPNDNCHNLSVGFWTQIGYHTQGQNGAGLGYFNEYPNKIQLQQQWAYIEKAVDNGGCGFDWGFRMDYVYGTDGPNTQAFGSVPGHWDTSWDHGVGDTGYGHAIPQLYAEVAYNDLKVKMGHFFTIVGYEVVPATGNFFYSHSYSMNFTEPFTHTGALAEFAYNDNVTLYGGWTTGWDTGFDRNGGDTFLGGAALQLTDKLSLTYILTYGDFGFETGNNSDSNGYSHSIVAVYDATDKWQYVFQTDYVNNDLFVDGAAGGADEIFTVNQYLFYAVNDCLKLGGRFEYYDNEGFGDENYALTLGANIKPHANMVVRPEVRWDWFDPAFASGIAGVGPRDQTVFGIDAIVTY